MNTWTCKGLLPAVLCLALTGCDTAGGLNFAAVRGARGAAPLTSAALADGAVTLVPPLGYCIDRRSLRPDFALMARCDLLGGDAGAGAPLAIITATAVPAGDGAVQTFSNLHSADETVLGRDMTETLSLVHMQGTPPIADARDMYWRGAGRIGDQIIGLAIYEADGSPSLGVMAAELLKQVMQRTADASATQTAALQDNSATSETIPE